jgi:hypothetical protein
MALIASGGETKGFEEVPEGGHKAICYRIVDAGTAEEEFNGEKKLQHRIYIFWELPEIKMDDGRPMSIFREYTLSLHERSNLYKDVMSWRNKPFTTDEIHSFDVTELLKKGCKVNVGRTSGDRAKVTSINSLPSAFDDNENLRDLPTSNEVQVFDLEDYCKEWSGQSNDASKAMCDMLEELPWFIGDRITGHDGSDRDERPPCVEVAAAKNKPESEGLSAIKKKKAAPKKKAEEEKSDPDFDDDIPF